MEETLALLERVHQGDKAARDHLFEKNTGLIYSVAKRFLGRGTDLEDLFQIGSIGLLKALDRFDPSFDVQFSSYAVPMIAGEIRRFLRDNGIVKIGRSVKERQYQIYQVKKSVEAQSGREATVQELAEKLNCTSEEIVFALESQVEVESLQKIIYQGEGSEIALEERVADVNCGQEKLLDRIFVEQLMGELGEKEQQLIQMRYYQNMTQTEISKILGVSQVQVSRMEKRILRRLKKQCEEDL